MLKKWKGLGILCLFFSAAIYDTNYLYILVSAEGAPRDRASAEGPGEWGGEIEGRSPERGGEAASYAPSQRPGYQTAAKWAKVNIKMFPSPTQY
jgi:hypothetical protein